MMIFSTLGPIPKAPGLRVSISSAWTGARVNCSESARWMPARTRPSSPSMDTGALTRLNEQPSGGGAPCFVSVDRSGRVALVANYAGGSVALLPIEANGALAPATHVVQHTGKGPNAERQQAPHAHCVLPDPSNRFALAADLGADRVFVYRLNLDANSLPHVEGGDAVMRPGAGPRHIAFHP